MDLTSAISRYLASFGRNPDSDVIAAYALVLHDLSDEQLRAGFNAAVRQDREHPLSAGQLRALCETGGIGREGLVERAWHALNRAIDKFGYTRSVSFADGLINATIRQLGGWERICSLPCEEFEKWFRRDFERKYLTLLSSGCPSHLTAPLVGCVERENQRYVGQLNPKTKKPYLLPAIALVDVDYRPSVPALPAPKREVADMPKLSLKQVPPDQNADTAERRVPIRMERKHDIPRSKRHEWTDKADLEFNLTQDQIAEQRANQKKLLALASDTVPA